MIKPNNLLLLDMGHVNQLLEDNDNGCRFLNPELGLVYSSKGLEEIGKQIFVPGQPYRLTEGRIVYARSGSVRVRVNLREVTVRAGQLVIVSPGTVIEFLDMEIDCDVLMLAFANSLMENWQREGLLQFYLQGRLFLNLSLQAEERGRMEVFFSLLWEVIHDQPFPRDTVRSLLSALFQQINAFRRHGAEVKPQGYNRQEEVFNKFLDLVNKYAVQERNVTFYAGRLFLTPRYLSTLIKQVSGRTVMDWVNDAVVLEAKLLLRHTDKMVYQISDELNFPNASFFCKFFRRFTGKTPHEFRQEE